MISCRSCDNAVVFSEKLPFVSESFGWCKRYRQVITPDALIVLWERRDLTCYAPKKEDK